MDKKLDTTYLIEGIFKLSADHLKGKEEKNR
jgi:hypothetical protein